jgi:hypothetical protein
MTVEARGRGEVQRGLEETPLVLVLPADGAEGLRLEDEHLAGDGREAVAKVGEEANAGGVPFAVEEFVGGVVEDGPSMKVSAAVRGDDENRAQG